VAWDSAKRLPPVPWLQISPPSDPTSCKKNLSVFKNTFKEKSEHVKWYRNLFQFGPIFSFQRQIEAVENATADVEVPTPRLIRPNSMWQKFEWMSFSLSLHINISFFFLSKKLFYIWWLLWITQSTDSVMTAIMLYFSVYQKLARI
jgi:hypothetical protein